MENWIERNPLSVTSSSSLHIQFIPKLFQKSEKKITTKERESHSSHSVSKKKEAIKMNTIEWFFWVEEGKQYVMDWYLLAYLLSFSMGKRRRTNFSSSYSSLLPSFPTFLLSIFVFHEVRSGFDLNGRMKLFSFFLLYLDQNLTPCFHWFSVIIPLHSQYILF